MTEEKRCYEITVTAQDAAGNQASVPMELEAVHAQNVQDAAEAVAVILKNAPPGGSGTIKAVADDH